MNDSAKKSQDFTLTFSVDQTPQEAFEAINDVRGWWSGNIDGSTNELGGEFTYRFAKVHFTRQKLTELVPGKRVVWLVVDSDLGFVKDTHEWTGTRVIFDLARKGDMTEVRLTHEGLVPALECYGGCSEGWTTYFRGSLRRLIATGKGRPDAKEKIRNRAKASASPGA